MIAGASAVALATVATVAVVTVSDPPEPPPVTTVTVESTYKGRSAFEWSQKAERRLARLARRERQLVRSRRDGRRLYAANRWLARTRPPWGNHWLDRAFSCIVHFEGEWDDPNPPYESGIQADRAFQRTYGPEWLRAFGTADHWPATVQISVAIKAHTIGRRGFGPWPTTRRYCGL